MKAPDVTDEDVRAAILAVQKRGETINFTNVAAQMGKGQCWFGRSNAGQKLRHIVEQAANAHWQQHFDIASEAISKLRANLKEGSRISVADVLSSCGWQNKWFYAPAQQRLKDFVKEKVFENIPVESRFVRCSHCLDLKSVEETKVVGRWRSGQPKYVCNTCLKKRQQEVAA